MSNHRNRIVDTQSHRLSCCKFSEPSIYDEISAVPAWISLCHSSSTSQKMPFSALLKPPLPPPPPPPEQRMKVFLAGATRWNHQARSAAPANVPFFFGLFFRLRCDDESTRNIPVTAACTRRRAAAIQERFPRKRAGRKMLPMRSRSWNFISWGGGVLCYRSSSGVTVLGRVGKQLLEEAELFRELAIQTFVVVFFWSKLTQRRQMIRIIIIRRRIWCLAAQRRSAAAAVAVAAPSAGLRIIWTTQRIIPDFVWLSPSLLWNQLVCRTFAVPSLLHSRCPQPPPSLSGRTINPRVIHKNWWHITFTAAPHSYSPFLSLAGRVLPFWQNTVLNVTLVVFSSVSQQALHTLTTSSQ